MNILGISAFYHDSAAAILQNGLIVAAAQEERFTRIKNDLSFPAHAIRFCLDETGLSIDELDAIVFYDKPLLKFERLLETYYHVAPKGVRSFIAAMPVWMKEKLFLKKKILDELAEIETYSRKALELLFPEHHLSHAASAFYPSSFKESAILTIDGVGEWATASLGFGEGNKISVLKELHFPHSLGLFYSSFTYFLGFKVNSGEYKLMGLAPYGNDKSKNFEQYTQIIKSKLIKIYDDGSIWLNPTYFVFSHKLKMIDTKKWEKLFQLALRTPDGEILAEHCDLALAVQRITEQIVLLMAQELKQLTNAKNICLAGGVALNSVANGKLLHSGLFENIYIQAAAGDAGGAIGAVLAAYHIYFEQERIISPNKDSMNGAYLGPHYSDFEIERMSRKNKAVFQHFESDANHRELE